jgi:hypothetical protein
VRRLKLRYSAGEERALLALLVLYKQFDPLATLGSLPKSIKLEPLFERQLDFKLWQSDMRVARSFRAANDDSNNNSNNNNNNMLVVDEQLNSTVTIARPALRELTRLDLTLDTSIATLSVPTAMVVRNGLVVVDELNTAPKLIASLHRVQLPDRLSALLGSRFVQHYVSLTADRDALQRLSTWLAFTLEHELRWRGTARTSVFRASAASLVSPATSAVASNDEQLMRALARWSRFSDETLPVLESFVVARLRSSSLATGLPCLRFVFVDAIRMRGLSL